jgi:hypothetical protein
MILSDTFRIYLGYEYINIECTQYMDYFGFLVNCLIDYLYLILKYK